MSEQATEVPDLLTVEEAARLSRMSKSSIYEAASKRELASVRLSPSGKRGKVLIERSALIRWIERCRKEEGEAEDDGELTYIR